LKAVLLRTFRNRPFSRRVLIHADGTPLPVYARGYASSVDGESQAHPDARFGLLTPDPDDRGRPVCFVPQDRRVHVRSEQHRHLLGHLGEQLRGGRRLGHQRRHAAESCLLVRKANDVEMRLRLGDRRAHKLRELAESGLGVRWQRTAVDGGGDHCAPQPTIDHDRGPHR
jgi:hypothetical protein